MHTAEHSLSVVSAKEFPLIEEMLKSLGKAFRAWQMYLPNNPSRHRAVSDTSTILQKCFDAYGDLTLQIKESEFLFEGEVVFRDIERPNDCIPWLLYRDGLREITFLASFGSSELQQFLSLLQTTRHAAQDDDDFVTMLWVADLGSIRYRYVEMSSSSEYGSYGDGSSSLSAKDNTGQAVRDGTISPFSTSSDDTPAFETTMPSGVIKLEDFDSTLHFLDRRELASLQAEIEEEFGKDPRYQVILILADMIEVQSNTEVCSSAIEQMEMVLIDLLTTGSYEIVASVIAEIHALLRRSDGLKLEDRQALQAIPERMSEPEVVRQLLDAVDDGSRSPGAHTLESLVAELKASALKPLLSWLTNAGAGSSSTVVERAALRLSERNTATLINLIEDEDINAARGAVKISRSLGVSAAVPALSRQLQNLGLSWRYEVVEALADIGSISAMQHIETLLTDSDRDIRILSAKLVAAKKYVAAAPKLSSIVRSKTLRSADRQEIAAFLEAYASVSGESAVASLDALLNGRSMLGPRESSEMRACAARALGLISSSDASNALRKASKTRDAVVRHEVSKLLRGTTLD